VDPQAYRYMIQTEGWQLLEVEIRSKIGYHRGRLMDCKTWEEVQQHRGAVESLESVLNHIDQTIREGNEEDE
jgi:hypothetical protein